MAPWEQQQWHRALHHIPHAPFEFRAVAAWSLSVDRACDMSRIAAWPHGKRSLGALTASLTPRVLSKDVTMVYNKPAALARVQQRKEQEMSTRKLAALIVTAIVALFGFGMIAAFFVDLDKTYDMSAMTALETVVAVAVFLLYSGVMTSACVSLYAALTDDYDKI
jgi:heme A synthase